MTNGMAKGLQGCDARPASAVPQQLTLAPMVLLAIGIEPALDVTVQGLHDADPREHRRAAKGCDQDQCFHCGLPFRRSVFRLRELGDVVASVAKGDELATFWQRDRFLEF